MECFPKATAEKQHSLDVRSPEARSPVVHTAC